MCNIKQDLKSWMLLFVSIDFFLVLTSCVSQHNCLIYIRINLETPFWKHIQSKSSSKQAQPKTFCRYCFQIRHQCLQYTKLIKSVGQELDT